MIPGLLDIEFRIGGSFLLELEYLDSAKNPISLTGWDVAAHVRPNFDSDVIYIAFSKDNGRITLDEPNGKITLKLLDTETDDIRWTTGVWDLRLTSPDQTQNFYLVEGTALAKLPATR